MGTIRALIGVGCAGLLAACTWTSPGSAVKAALAPGDDGAVVALLDTGSYPTTANHPFGKANKYGGTAEANRMAAYVVGPWTMNETLVAGHPVPGPGYAGAYALTFGADDASNGFTLLLDVDSRTDPRPGIAVAHGLIAGFWSYRDSADRRRQLMNTVMRFPDADAAGAAAAEMADQSPLPVTAAAPRQPKSIKNHPEAKATMYPTQDGGVAVESYTAHGPYLLHQLSYRSHNPSTRGNDESDAAGLIETVLARQAPVIDRFAPTDPAALAELPNDPSGQLLARTLWAIDGHAPASVGVRSPDAAVHYEDDPIAADQLFKDTGVEWVSQYLTRVYQAQTSDNAIRLAERYTAQVAAVSGVKPISGVTGLPTASCFQRTTGHLATDDETSSFQIMQWSYKCVGRADRYAFVAVGTSEKDAKQRTAAQYRILAGK